MAGKVPGDGYLIEFRPAGASVQVIAIDPLTGLEVSIVGPSNAAQSDLVALAVRKLERALGSSSRERSQSGSAPSGTGRKGGIIV